MVNLFFSLLFSLSIVAIPQWVSAASIAATLSDYKATLKTENEEVSGLSFSGVSFHPGSKTLFVIDDAAKNVYEFNTEAKLVRSIGLSGFDDTEGIAWQSGQYFLIVEERLANLHRIQIPEEGTGPVTHNESMPYLSLGENFGNSGLEGVAFDKINELAYVVKEKDPVTLYKVSLDDEGYPSDYTTDDPFDISQIDGDAADIYVLSDGNFLLLNQEQNILYGYDTTGKILSELELDMKKPEGVAVDESTGIITVVGEPREFYVFENPEAPILISKESILRPSLSKTRIKLFNGTLVFEHILPNPINGIQRHFTIRGSVTKPNGTLPASFQPHNIKKTTSN